MVKMFVIKRGKNPLNFIPVALKLILIEFFGYFADGRKEEVHFDKITSRIQKLCYGLNMDFVDPVSDLFGFVLVEFMELHEIEYFYCCLSRSESFWMFLLTLATHLIVLGLNYYESHQRPLHWRYNYGA